MRRHGYTDDGNRMILQRRVYFGVLVIVCVLLLCGAFAAAGYWGWKIYSLRGQYDHERQEGDSADQTDWEYDPDENNYVLVEYEAEPDPGQEEELDGEEDRNLMGFDIRTEEGDVIPVGVDLIPPEPEPGKPKQPKVEIRPEEEKEENKEETKEEEEEEQEIKPNEPGIGFGPVEPKEDFPDEVDIPDVPERPEVTDEDLARISQMLWDLDVNRLPADEYELNVQGHTNMSIRQDRAPARLFTYMKVDLSTWSATFNKFVPLLDNYVVTTRRQENINEAQWQEIDNFLESIMETDVIRALNDHLKTKGYIRGDRKFFKQQLRKIWFNLYARSPKNNISDSSGFEHIFVGELKKGRAVGFHNWIQFFLEERAGNVDYYGYHYFRPDQPWMINVKFKWHQKLKKETSFFIGTSPEFDIAIYTLCMLTRIGRPCPISINGMRPTIQTFDILHIPGLQPASAVISI